MANVKFNKKLFEKEIGKLDEKMQHKIAMFGTPVETITEEEIELEIFPNRPDLLSYQGFKRGFLAFLEKAVGLKQYKINKPEKDFFVVIDSSVSDIRPFTACAIVKNLKFDNEKIKEIIDIQEKIHNTLGRKRKKVAIGIYPLEKIKLPLTFKALEPEKIKFQPLESEREMSGIEILQRHPAGRDYAHLLAGKTKFPIFIDANNEILSMPPIINSHKTGKITEDTTDLFIECSGFDFPVLNKCLNILTTTLSDLGGKIYQMELKYKKSTNPITPDLTPEKMNFSIENTNKLLGLQLNEKQIKNFLERMGHDYNKGVVSVASWRTDVLHEVDLIEDIAIAYGYDNFIPEIPKISTIGQEDKKETLKRTIAEILSAIELLEISNYHLTTKEDQIEKMGFNGKEQAVSKEIIEIENSKTEYNILRNNLTHYALKILGENIDVPYPHKVFEIGKVFKLEKHDKEKTEIIEKEHLSIALSPANFTELKQTFLYLLSMMSIKDISITEPESTVNTSYFIEGRVGEIKLNRNGKTQTLGFLGEIHPRILKNWKIKMPVALLEISLDEILDELEKR